MTDKVKLLNTRSEAHSEEDNHSDESEGAVFIEDTPEIPQKQRTECILCRKTNISDGLHAMIYSIGQGLIEGSYAIPLLLTVGINLEYTGFIFAISFLILILNQGFRHCCICFTLGSRPLIFLLCLTACVGLIITPFSPYISTINKLSWTTTLSIIITVLGIVIVDFSLGQLQLYTRPFLLSSRNNQLTTTTHTKATTGNFLYAFPISCGLSISFSLGAISLEALLNTEVTILRKCQYIFVITLAIIVVLSLFSLFSTTNHDTTKITCKKSVCSDDPPIHGLFQLIYFMNLMTKEMWILCTTVFLSTLSMFPLLLYFTTIVSLSTHNGVLPNSVHDVQAFKVYSEGIRKGCFALAISASFVIILSLILTPLTKSIRLRIIFLTIQYLFVIALFIFSYWPTKLLSIIVIGSCLLACYCMYETVPFSILLLYKENDKIIRDSTLFTEEEIHKSAVTVLNCSYLWSKLLVAIMMCPLIVWLGGVGTGILTTSCLLGATGAILATFIDIPTQLN